MLLNPQVDTRTYIEGIEVITPRSIPNRIVGIHDTTARNWLRRADAPQPMAKMSGGATYWKADEAIAYLEQKFEQQKALEAIGKRVGRPRKK